MHPSLSLSVNVFPSPFLLMCLLCWGKHLQLLPHSWSAFSPTLLLPPAWSLLGGNVAYNGPKVNHLQVSPDKSQCVCCAPSRVSSSCGDVPRVAYGIQALAQMGGNVLRRLSEHHHLECLHCPEGTCLSLQWTQLRDAKKNEPNLLDGQMAWHVQWNLLIIWASCVMYCLNSKG